MVPTDEMALDLTRLGFDRLRVVGRGVNSMTFSPSKRDPALREQWCASDDTPVALCVSRFAPEKNFPLVFDAYRAMRAVRPDTRLVLVGDGPMEQELKREGMAVVIAGRVEDGELSAHYASADIFLFPSTSETFGNVTMEAMASGLAVVAYDYAAARQHIVHGRSGSLAPVNDRNAFIDQAAALACDLPRVRALGRGARAAAEPLSWRKVVAEFEEVLLETLSLHALMAGRRHAAA
jgi:glycosyltransferase involved in cell wall biosynthesis